MDGSAPQTTDLWRSAPDIEFQDPPDPAVQIALSRRGFYPVVDGRRHDLRRWNRRRQAKSGGRAPLTALDPVAAALYSEVAGVELADPRPSEDVDHRLFISAAGAGRWRKSLGFDVDGRLALIGSADIPPLLPVSTHRSRPRVTDHLRPPCVKEVTAIAHRRPATSPAQVVEVIRAGGRAWGLDGDAIRARLAEVDVVVAPATGFRSSIDHAKVVLIAAAMAIPTIIRNAAWLSRWVDADILRLLASIDGDRLIADSFYRDAIGVWLRRRVLAVHTEADAWKRVRAALALETAAPPAVGVLLATRRPELVPGVIKSINSQSLRPSRVLIALGGNRDEIGSNRWEAAAELDVEVLSLPPSLPEGELFNQALARLDDGVALTWGDSDHYGRFHIEDMVQGLAHARGAVAGKGPEFVHIPRLGITVQRSPASRYEDTDFISDTAMAFHAGAIQTVGGFPAVSDHPGRALIRRLREMGHQPYRLHGYQYIVTSRAPAGLDDYLVGDSVRQWPGLALAGAGFDGPDNLVTSRRYR